MSKHTLTSFIERCIECTANGITSTDVCIIVWFDPYENALLADKVKMIQELERQNQKVIYVTRDYIEFGEKNSKKIRFLPFGFFKIPKANRYIIGHHTTLESGYIEHHVSDYIFGKAYGGSEWDAYDLWLPTYELDKDHSLSTAAERYYFSDYYNDRDKEITYNGTDGNRYVYSSQRSTFYLRVKHIRMKPKQTTTLKELKSRGVLPCGRTDC